MEHTKETRLKMSEAKKKFFANGGKPWNKTNTEILCKNCGKSFHIRPARLKTAKYCSRECAKGHNVFAKGNVPWNKGKEHLRGEKHWNWQGGIDGEHNRIKQTKEYKDWRQAVYRRDRWTCQTCGYKGRQIVAHHIKLFSKYPKLRFDVDNGMVLCRPCHVIEHKPRRKNYHDDS